MKETEGTARRFTIKEEVECAERRVAVPEIDELVEWIESLRAEKIRVFLGLISGGWPWSHDNGRFTVVLSAKVDG